MAAYLLHWVKWEDGLEVGRIIGGKYRLLREIGVGGMGSVWSAVHETLDRTVAIKFLRPSIEDAATASARFVAEAKSAARVKHRFVVDVFDFGITEDGVYYMVQELLEGEELADCMFQGPAWEVADVVQFMVHCLSGLEAVHQAGIVHRDLKPENIFVIREHDGRFPKLLDFGISKMSERSSVAKSRVAARGARPKQLTTQGTALGTPWYMSPEQLRGRRDLDGRADVYSLGVIMYEWLTGSVPYAEDNVAELSLQVASGKAAPLVSIRPELGHGLSSVIARALAPEASDRFASAGEMREALTEIKDGLPKAWSTGPKVAKAAPAQGKGLRGAKTELLLESASSPFADDDAPRPPMVGLGKGRLRSGLIATAVLVVIVLVSIPFFRDARPERANAKPVGSPAGTGAARAPDGPAAAPALVVPAVPEPAAEVDVARPEVASPLAVPLEATEPKARTGARSSTGSTRAEKPAATEGSRPTRAKKTQNKVIRTLDF